MIKFKLPSLYKDTFSAQKPIHTSFKTARMCALEMPFNELTQPLYF